MANSLQTAGAITGMKRGGHKPMQPMSNGGNKDVKSAVRFLDTHPMGGMAKGKKR